MSKKAMGARRTRRYAWSWMLTAARTPHARPHCVRLNASTPPMSPSEKYPCKQGWKKEGWLVGGSVACRAWEGGESVVQE